MSEEVVPAPAATVVVVRPGLVGEAEILLLRRHARAGFMANVWVFPGGRVDAVDGGADGGDAFVRAAVRETEEEAGIRLGNELVYCAHWVTPKSERKRFDTRFYLTNVGEGVEARPDETEVTAAEWVTAASALERHAARGFPLAPPTWLTLWSLRGMDVARALAWARGASPVPETPELGLSGGRLEVRTSVGTLALADGIWTLAP